MLQPQGAGPARLDACAQDEKHSMRGHPGRTPKDVLSNQQVAEKSAGEVTETPSFSGSKAGCLFKKGNVLSCSTTHDQSGVTKFPSGHKEVVVVGDAGVDKTLTMKEAVSKFTYMVISQKDLCAQTSRKKDTYGPTSGKRTVLMIDDLSMRAKHLFGSQTPLGLLRRCLDFHYGLWYDRQEQFVKYGKDIQLLQGSLANFEDEVQGLCDTLTNPTITLHHAVGKELLPTPPRLHYLLDLLHVCKILQGSLQAKCGMGGHDTKTDLLELWTHKCFGIFADGMIDNKGRAFLRQLFCRAGALSSFSSSGAQAPTDRAFFQASIDDLLTTDAFSSALEIPFAIRVTPNCRDFTCDLDPEHRYKESGDSSVKAFRKSRVEEYDYEPGGGFVLFGGAIEHICRIARIIGMHRRSALFIGGVGNGHQSLSRLAAFLKGFKIFTIEITMTYGRAEFHEDLTKHVEAGVSHKVAVFSLCDPQMAKKAFVEGKNGQSVGLLSTGEVPNHFRPDEMGGIGEGSAQAARSAGVEETSDALCNFFFEQARGRMHVLLSFSPMDDSFRIRCRKFLPQFPALMSGTSVDRFSEWLAKREAVQEVSLKFTKKVNPGSDQVKTSVTERMVTAQASVSRVSQLMLADRKGEKYLTPTKYMELVTGYLWLLAERRAKLEDLVRKLVRAVDKIEAVQKEVEKMRKVLVVDSPTYHNHTKLAAASSRKTPRKARAARRGLQVVDEEAAEIAGGLEQVAAERRTAKARPGGLPSRVENWNRTATLAPASMDEEVVEDERKRPARASELAWLGKCHVGQVGGSWGPASVRNLECELREEAKARRAAAERPSPEQASGSVIRIRETSLDGNDGNRTASIGSRGSCSLVVSTGGLKMSSASRKADPLYVKGNFTQARALQGLGREALTANPPRTPPEGWMIIPGSTRIMQGHTQAIKARCDDEWFENNARAKSKESKEVKAEKALVAVEETTTRVVRGAAVITAVDLEKESPASAHPASKPRVPRVAKIPAKVMQVCLRTSRGAAFHRLPHDMPITDVKRLLIEAFCSELTRSPFTIAFAVKRLWHQTWLKCNGRRLAEECTVQSSNVGANAIIDLEVRLRGGMLPQGVAEANSGAAETAPDARARDNAEASVSGVEPGIDVATDKIMEGETIAKELEEQLDDLRDGLKGMNFDFADQVSAGFVPPETGNESPKMSVAKKNSVAAEHARLSKMGMDPSRLVRGKYGDMSLFDRRLEEDVGFMDADPLRGIMVEHVISANSRTPFVPPNNPGLRCTPEGEWYFVVGKTADTDGFKKDTFDLDLTVLPSYEDSALVEGRNVKSLGELMREPEVERAGLLLAEVVALRLFSGPMYWMYNEVLRDSLSINLRHRASGLKWKSVGGTRPTDGEELKLPGLAAALVGKTEFLPEEWTAFGCRDLRMDHYVEADKCFFQPVGRDLTVNLFSTTLHVITSGICKLSRIEKMPAGRATMEVYRGLAGVVLPLEFFEPDAQGFRGAVDASFMSASKDKEVARRYSTARQGRAATVFKLVLGKKSLGADISWLSQFEREREVLFPPRTHLEIIEEPELDSDDVSIITLRPTTYQNVSTVEEVMSSRKADLKSLSSSLVWDLRNEAARDGKLDSEVAQRLDAFEGQLVAGIYQANGWYNDNKKYQGAFNDLFSAVKKAQQGMYDERSLFARNLAESGTARKGPGVADAQQSAPVDGAASSAPTTQPLTAQQPMPGSAGPSAPVSGATNQVSLLHGKFAQDPNFKGFKGTFGSDDLFAVGIVAVVGSLDVQFVRAMYNEHCTGSEARTQFTAWNAGHVIETTPLREWLFVVGLEGVDLHTWEIVVSKSEPDVADDMMVTGRNAKRLAELLETCEARLASLAPAEVVAVRLYTGPMYVRYNTVLRAMGDVSAAGLARYSATIHLICSALLKLSRITPPPPGLIVYRGTGGMALGPDFLEPDEQGCLGGAEAGLMSTSPDRDVALGYSGISKGKDLPTLFEIEVGKTSIGADVSMFSQFQREREYLCPPLTYLEIVDTPRVVSYKGQKLSVLRMRLTINQKTQTVEQASRSRRDFLERLVTSMQWRVRHWARERELLERLELPIQQFQSVLYEVIDAAQASTLNDNDTFADMFKMIFDTADDESIRIAELLWQDSEKAQTASLHREACKLLKKAIVARDGRSRAGLCQDKKAGRNRVSEMQAYVVDMQEERARVGSFVLDDTEKIQLAEDKLELADSLKDKGEFDAAMAMYQQGLDVFVSVRGHLCEDVAKTEKKIGVVQYSLGNFGKSLFHFSKAQEVYLAVHGQNSADVATTHLCLGSVHNSQADHDKALFHYGRAQEVYLAVFGEESPELAKTHNGLGNVHALLREFELALFHYGKAVEVNLAVYGQDHIEVAKAYNNQGLVYKDLAQYDHALDSLSKALNIKIKLVGPDSRDAAKTQEGIGMVYDKLGDFEKALLHYGKAEEAYISVYGNQSGQHPDVADAYRNIGGVHASLDNHEKALHYYGKAEEVYLAVYGRQHLLVADTLMGTGAVYHKQGRAAEAKESFSRAHQIRLDKLGPDHDKTLDARRHAEMVGRGCKVGSGWQG